MATKPKAGIRKGAKAAPKATKTSPAKAGKAARAKALVLKGLSPSITVNDLEKSLRFYVDALGFKVTHRWESAGKLMGVMVGAGECEIGLSQDDWAKGKKRVKGAGLRIYAETWQDLGALADRVRANGFAAEGPKKEPWGATVVAVDDPDGFHLTFHGRMN
jgi:catechol 2,3-dioxygenase-like lactoylglutathione lyase family enzyme